jgi:hypothetical protein
VSGYELAYKTLKHGPKRKDADRWTALHTAWHKFFLASQNLAGVSQAVNNTHGPWTTPCDHTYLDMERIARAWGSMEVLCLAGGSRFKLKRRKKR